jgi:hypothetical protein
LQVQEVSKIRDAVLDHTLTDKNDKLSALKKTADEIFSPVATMKLALLAKVWCYLTPHTSHLTPHTSHLTPHTSHLTPHTSHLTPHQGVVLRRAVRELQGSHRV